MSDLEILITSLIAMVDQRSAEYNDPETSQERKAQILADIRVLYDELVEIQRKL